MLEAIRAATRSVNMELLHLPARPHRRSVHRRLCRIARAQGVNVTIVVDAIGSFSLWGRPCAGCARPAAGSSRISGCAGTRWRASTTARTASCWSSTAGSRLPAAPGSPTGGRIRSRGKRPWRDTMAKFEGPIVAALQGVAAENWLECCGEILTRAGATSPISIRTARRPPSSIRSSPSDRATASRVTFQLLMEGADQQVRISTPYFLPDRALRRALEGYRPARRDRLGDRAGQQHRSALGPPRQPAHVGSAAAGRRPRLRVPRRR